ncbi:23S rRNA (cytosine1962-C5)-methyltransferase [Natranaerovirga pectinivora]|uniref:23S rRNA (Cytosine1962-C5)-methyltransferase n=1 Tax=Natranaerovirga pectinivora TaxID=682400 RepID=A0A4V2V0G4_9FIRM|nr:class I SAM-dependent rRNA methyltransferase [Natranaerovirga pectinivora]TCT16057.1 23S rRNA (cytosine1962-C5)-methyltransferase [Natranaerovirga pectinivora]
MTEIRAQKKYDNKYKEGFPLLKESFINYNASVYKEGNIFTLLDHKGQFIAKGYFGNQNKGIGWLLSWKKNEHIDRNFFKSKVSEAINNRSGYYQDTNTTAFRVFNGEGDGVGGMTIDYFDGYYLFNWYSEGIYTFRDEIIDMLCELVDYKGIYEKKRFNESRDDLDKEDFVKGERATFPLIVKENGVNIAVNLDDGPMVGVFLDQRDVRKALMSKYAKGKTVLNTFSYTGVFSVFALMGGASMTESVDLAKRSTHLTIEQMTINGIDDSKQSIVVMDVFDYFNRGKQKDKDFDIVILDPPSYARSKKHTFSAAKDYAQLISKALDMTSKEGMLIASTNHSALKREKFWEMIQQGFAARGEKAEIVESFGLPSDFRVNKALKESDYLKVYFLKRRK